MGNLGTNLAGTNLSTRLSLSLTGGELTDLEYYLARNAFSWLRADYRNEAGGKVTAFFDKVALVSEGAVAPNARSVDPAHALTQATPANQVAAVSPSANFNGRESAVFTTSQLYNSSIAAINWALLHNGLGSTIYEVYRNASTGAWQCLHATTTSTPGTVFYPRAFSTVKLEWAAFGAGNTLFDISGGTCDTAPAWASMSLLGTGYSWKKKGATLSSGTTAFAPTATAPSFPFRLGALAAGTAGFDGEWLDTIVVPSTDTIVLAKVERYLSLRYPALA